MGFPFGVSNGVQFYTSLLMLVKRLRPALVPHLHSCRQKLNFS